MKRLRRVIFRAAGCRGVSVSFALTHHIHKRFTEKPAELLSFGFRRLSLGNHLTYPLSIPIVRAPLRCSPFAWTVGLVGGKVARSGSNAHMGMTGREPAGGVDAKDDDRRNLFSGRLLQRLVRIGRLRVASIPDGVSILPP